jgi:hypothetical protein
LLLVSLSSSTASGEQLTKPQCISTNEEGQDLRHAGKLHEAAERFKACSTVTCPTALRADCATRLEDVQRAMPTIIVEAKDSRGVRVTDVMVTIDGAPLTDHLDGTVLLVDPGRHHLAFKRRGESGVQRDWVFHEGEKERHESITLASAPSPRGESANENPGPPTAAYAALIVAGAALIGGGIFTGLAIYEKNLCPNDSGQLHCPAGISDQENDATVRRDSIVAGVAYGAAIVSGGVGLWLWLSSSSAQLSKSSARSPIVEPLIAHRWIGLGGRF